MEDKGRRSKMGDGRKRILVIHHSGSGSTRTIAEVVSEKLLESFDVEMAPITISSDFDFEKIQDADMIVFGSPTFNCKPSRSMLEFIDKMPIQKVPKKGYLFMTCGLYLGNALRILAKRLYEKNIVLVGYEKFRGPASDGALLFPSSINFIFKYERGAEKKIERVLSDIERGLQGEVKRPKIPAYKWYVPINDIFLYFGEKTYNKYSRNLHVISERCLNCNTCVKGCIRECWEEGEKIPTFDPENCELCLKCVHNCPSMAIAFSKAMMDRPRLNRKFYRDLKEGLLLG